MVEKTKEIKGKSFAQEVREFFGMPEPGQKKITKAEFEKQADTSGKIPTKAGEPKKKRTRVSK